MSINPYAFLLANNNNFSIESRFRSFSVLRLEAVEGFETRQGFISNDPLTVIALPAKAFKWNRKQGTNSTRSDIKWLVQEYMRHKLNYVKHQEYILGWTTNSGIASEAVSLTTCTSASMLRDPALIWSWIVFVCSHPKYIQHRGRLREGFDHWKSGRAPGEVRLATYLRHSTGATDLAQGARFR